LFRVPTNGWLDEACLHMTAKLIYHRDKASIAASARKYNSRSRFKAADSGAYKAAVRRGWLEEVCAHMQTLRRSWSLPRLRKSTAQYVTRSAWKQADPGAYKAAHTNGILADVCKHMSRHQKPSGWWTKARVMTSARLFHSIAAWDAGDTSAVQTARRRGLIEEATQHMEMAPMPVGPATIHEFLIAHRIPYKAEHRFKQHPEVRRMPFYFFIPERRLLIEYHGRQHTEGWSRDAESLREIQRRDALKDRWAATSDYTLISILAWKTKTPAAIRQLLAQTLDVPPGLPKPLTDTERKRIRSGRAWTIDGVLADAKNYQSRAAWMKASSSAYRFALRHSMSDIAFDSQARVLVT
jgi:hypothetical protein